MAPNHLRAVDPDQDGIGGDGSTDKEELNWGCLGALIADLAVLIGIVAVVWIVFW